MMKDNRLAVAVYCTDNGDLYDLPLFSVEEVEQVKSGTHPEIFDDFRVIVVYRDLSTECFT